jgi:glutamyl-tRNA reductase
MAQDGLGALRVLTLNHQNVGLGALAQVALSPDRVKALRRRFVEAGLDAIVLATCNRTDIYWHAPASEDDARARRLLVTDLSLRASTGHPHTLQGTAAAVHIFRVCAGIESLVLGEAEILGQVRSALDASPCTGRFLPRVIQAGLRAGGIARAETEIGVGALSVASAAVRRLAATVALDRARVVVVGTGTTGVKAARQLRARGVSGLVLINRTRQRAEAISGVVDAEVAGLEDLEGELRVADVVICAVASPAPIVDLGQLRAAAAHRAGRRLTIVDLSMPPVVEHGAVAGVTRIDLGDLERHVESQRERRVAEIPKVEALIAREIHHLRLWAERQATRRLEAGATRVGTERAAEVRP